MGHWMRGALAALALTAAFTTTPGWAAERELRITLQLPISSHIGQNLLMFEQEVEANSNGAIDVQIYDSAQLFKDDEVIGAVLTFREWLEDFASPEAQALCEPLIRKELGEVECNLPQFFPQVKDYHTRIQDGERDLYF